MSIEKGKISGLQLMFLLTGLVQGSIFLTSYIIQLTKHDSSLVILAGLAATIPFALVYASLAKRFAGMHLIQINEIVYGTYFGKAVSILYIFYFLMVLSFNFRNFSDFYVTFVIPDTPQIFFLVIFPLVCAYAVSKGIEVLARISHLVVTLIFFLLTSIFLFLLPNMDFSNFLPVFELPLKNFFQGIHIIVTIPFGEIFILLTFASSLNDTKHTVRNTVVALLLGAICFLLVTVRNTAVLGSTEYIFESPAFYAVRLINFGNVFTRMDILFGIGQTISIFLKTSLFYYALITSLAQFLRLKTYLPLILPVGGIAVIVAITDWQSSAEAAKAAPTIAPIFITPFLVIFPILTLLIAKIRKLPKEGRLKN